MKPIFVFGSNEAGRHGKGAALHARQEYGAKYGVGRGHTGNAYAIPTKDHNIRTRSLPDIKMDVDIFLNYARAHQELTFQMTRIGCGLAGYTDAQIAPLFRGAPENIIMPPEWEPYLKEKTMVVAIIGSAGRGETGKLWNREVYIKAVWYVRSLLEALPEGVENIQLRSGGAAWADHMAITLFYGWYHKGKNPRLHLCLPCEWDFSNHRFVDNGSHDFRTNPGGTLNYYHRKFSQVMEANSLATIEEALKIPRLVTYEVFPGLHARNIHTGKCDRMYALTWGGGTEPADGGTNHCWSNSPSPFKLHIPLKQFI